MADMCFILHAFILCYYILSITWTVRFGLRELACSGETKKIDIAVNCIPLH